MSRFRLNRLVLKNFCQHGSRDVTFVPGINGILGPNGCGKSNFLGAMLKALTGASGNTGVKTDDLRWGEDNGFVQLFFSLDGVEGSIKRQLRSAGCHLKFGSETFTRALDCNAKLAELIADSKLE